MRDYEPTDGDDGDLVRPTRRPLVTGLRGGTCECPVIECPHNLFAEPDLTNPEPWEYAGIEV
jgi:hypothetical protein